MKVSQTRQMKEKKALAPQRSRQTPRPANQAWGSIQWRTLEQYVLYIQTDIYRASQSGDRRAVHALQQQLIASEPARLLAVRRATEENDGKDTAGIDGVKSLNPKERLAMVETIHPAYWGQQPPRPGRRVWIPKSGTVERRPLAILPMIDRCKQALVKLALEPEWEAKFELHSYGFRPDRSAQDAIRAILRALKQRSSFVFDADIEAAFDSVNQAALLEKLSTYPALRQTIHAWLKAGVVDGGTYMPGNTGISQGGALSPLLMNVALHGMEAVVRGDNAADYAMPLVVRYADDFVVLHSTLSELQQTARRLRQWLARIGLQLNAHKTRITHTLTPFQGQAGFDFLGFTLRQYPIEKIAGKSPGFQTILTPSEEASKRHLAVISQRLLKLQSAPQAQVIRELNPIIGGWAAYYNGIVSAEAMSRYDEQLEHLLMSWASKRHPNKARDWLLNRYWQHVGKREWIFTAPEGAQLRPYRRSNGQDRAR